MFFKETVIFVPFTYTKYPIKGYFVNKGPPYCIEKVQEQKLSDIISIKYFERLLLNKFYNVLPTCFTMHCIYDMQEGLID